MRYRLDKGYQELLDTQRIEDCVEDVYVRAFYAQLKNLKKGAKGTKSISDEAKEIALRVFDLRASSYKMEVIEALLLSGANSKEIEEVLSISPAATELYARLYFDTNAFADDLDRLDYGMTYSGSKYGRELKAYAMDQGKVSLLIKLSRGKYVASKEEIKSNILSTSYMLAQEVRANPLSSTQTREAFRWAQLGINNATKKDDSGIDVSEEIRIALETTATTFNEENDNTNVNAEDILH